MPYGSKVNKKINRIWVLAKGGLKKINGTWAPFTNILKIDGGVWK